jgi:hypothetical protein
MTDISKNAELQQSCITAVKSRFFAQYWGQEICQTKGGKYTIDEDCFPLWEKSYLELKPLSQITDEDAVTVRELVKDTFYFDEEYDAKQLNRAVIRMITEHTGSWLHVGNCMYAIDYLRGKGYALPFMEYSVSDMISFGWVQLL